MARYQVTLDWVDGPTRTIDAEADETVLAAARPDAALPFGCRTGACGTCVGRLLEVDDEGSDDTAFDVADAFAYRREPRALKPRHRDDGYVLLCIASPRANSRVAVGSQVHSDLVDNPWK